jgi:hypothetical protein
MRATCGGYSPLITRSSSNGTVMRSPDSDLGAYPEAREFRTLMWTTDSEGHQGASTDHENRSLLRQCGRRHPGPGDQR